MALTSILAFIQLAIRSTTALSSTCVVQPKHLQVVYLIATDLHIHAQLLIAEVTIWNHLAASLQAWVENGFV